MSSPRYKLYSVDWMTALRHGWGYRGPLTLEPGATAVFPDGRTWVLTPVGVWWTPQERPSNCGDTSRPVCSWQDKMSGHGTTLHVEKAPCRFCGIGNGSIGIFHKEGYLWYHGYIQHGWLEGD